MFVLLAISVSFLIYNKQQIYDGRAREKDKYEKNPIKIGKRK